MAHDGDPDDAIGTTEATEIHESAGDYVKSLVFGGVDGTLTAFAIVSAAAGASMTAETVLILGVANVVADGVAMGLGDVVSARAEQEYVRTEHEREAWELENYPEGEFREMMAIFTRRYNVTVGDASTMLTVMIKYRALFLETMTHLELGLLPPDDDALLWRKGLAMFLSFVTCGCAPLLAFALCGPLRWSPRDTFLASCFATAFTLSALGYVKAGLTKQPRWRGAATILATGAVAAFVAYGVGWGSQLVLALNNHHHGAGGGGGGGDTSGAEY